MSTIGKQIIDGLEQLVADLKNGKPLNTRTVEQAAIKAGVIEECEYHGGWYVVGHRPSGKVPGTFSTPEAALLAWHKIMRRKAGGP